MSVKTSTRMACRSLVADEAKIGTLTTTAGTILFTGTVTLLWVSLGDN
jgi:hypothetical protein